MLYDMAWHGMAWWDPLPPNTTTIYITRNSVNSLDTTAPEHRLISLQSSDTEYSSQVGVPSYQLVRLQPYQASLGCNTCITALTDIISHGIDREFECLRPHQPHHPLSNYCPIYWSLGSSYLAYRPCGHSPAFLACQGPLLCY